ncbi:hypothetical protein BH18THE1_BH18THE1_00480 [soil metagenome]
MVRLYIQGNDVKVLRKRILVKYFITKKHSIIQKKQSDFRGRIEKVGEHWTRLEGVNETMNSILDAIYSVRYTHCSKCGEALENQQDEICDWCKLNNNE